MNDDDPYLWLEDITGEKPLAWVRARNAESTTEFGGEPFERLRAEIREVFDAEERIPYVRRRGEHLYNFWQDAAHPRGLWRRTTLDEYRTDSPTWQVLIDLDALAAAEDENWVWQSAVVLRPGHRRALVHLSRGGADASVVREFDLETATFVADGFSLPESKTFVSWIAPDHVYVGTDLGEGSLTGSGYPRVVRQWRHGTPVAEAPVVYQAEPDDVLAYGHRDPIDDRDFVVRRIDFQRSERFLRRGDRLVRIEVPDDAEIVTHATWLLVRTRSEWTVDGVRHPAGALLAARFDDFLAGSGPLTALFCPDRHTALVSYDWTRDHLILTTLRDVTSHLEVLTPPAPPGGGADPDGAAETDPGGAAETEPGGGGPAGTWRRRPIGDIPALTSATVVGTDPDGSDEYWIEVTGYTQPGTLLRGDAGSELEPVKGAPEFFDVGDLSVRQLFATSDDGTRVPYFLVGPTEPNGPTLLYGYGGVEIPLTPAYSGVIGRGWLARGGSYAVANIRGGGEYGPRWHQAAIRGNRFRAFEDFAAVARDLAERGLASPERLGILGGSNGGLLTGVMLTRYPSRFGAVVSQVPLLDMLRYHELLAGASWISEYGDPDDPDDRGYLREYSPYHNAAGGRRYPPSLFMTSTRDDRVHPGHARKMVARLRELGQQVWYHENLEGGHGAAVNNEQQAFKWALVFEFLWRMLAGESVAPEPEKRHDDSIIAANWSDKCR